MKVAAIIPAFNEEATIGQVIRAVKGAGLVSEVIVVDDGSKDRTAAVAAAAGARVVSLPENVGKGGAMKAGAETTDADVLLYLDADLTGLERGHLHDLLAPVLAGEVDMTVGVFDEGRLATDIAQRIAPFLSGQRAIRRSILLEIPQLETSRYGVEVVISRYAEKCGLRVARVYLKHVGQVMKEEKLGFWKGFGARLRMYWEIIRQSRL